MTDTFHELLRESVAEVEMPDVADAAWLAGARARRRRTTTALAGVVGAVLAGSSVVWLADHDSRAGSVGPGPAPRVTSTPSGAPGGNTPDASRHGVRYWWGPDLDQESRLPAQPGPLPAHIDVGATAPDLATHPVLIATAAFAVFDDRGVTRLVVLAPDGTLRSLDVSRLNKVTKANGYRLAPETPSMLSPSGQYLMFPQDGSVLVYTLRTGVWTTVHTGNAWTNDVTWLTDSSFFLPQHGPGTPGPSYGVQGARLGTASPPGPAASQTLARSEAYGLRQVGPGSTAQSYYLGPQLPRPSDTVSGQGIVSTDITGAVSDVLEVGGSGRWKNCCAAIGWLDDGTVVYESVGPVTRLIAWRVGTHDFGQVATITGVTAGREFYVSSWARMWASGSVG